MSSILMFILFLMSLASAVASFVALYQLTRNAEQEIQESYDRLEKRLSENIDKYVKEIKELDDEGEIK